MNPAPIKIAIIGYGKMGHEVEQMALQRGHEIALIIDRDNLNDMGPENLRSSDVAIEFTTPKAAPSNIRSCLNAGIPVVSGTTGWDDEMDQIKKDCEKGDHAFFYAPNFSIGVNLFFRINEMVGLWMNQLDAYEVRISETHHQHKVDKPSGTAAAIARDLVAVLERKDRWISDPPGEWGPGAIPVFSERHGSVPGTHVVRWDSAVDVIELKHESKNRKGFALGALLAAEYIKNRKGIYGMKDLLGF